MFKPAALFIGLRYTKAKRRNHFISFVSLMSMFGIALGVIVLITVLSVMNGFDKEIKQRVFSMVAPITITGFRQSIMDWQTLQKNIATNSSVVASAPFVEGEVLLTHAGQVAPALINGILPAEENKITNLGSKVILGQLKDLIPGSFTILLGETLANRLDVGLGDKVTMITPEVSVSIVGVNPRSRRFTVVGIFRAGSGFGFDSSLGFINLSDAQKLFLLNTGVTGLHIKNTDVFQAPYVSKQLSESVSPIMNVTDWTYQFGAFFHAISMEKTMMFLLLMLIIGIAAFNLVCSLVMVVNEKEADIAILRTMGASSKTILMIFIVQGGVIGLIGTLLGVLGGIALATHVTPLVAWLETVLHTQFVSASVYYVNYLPSELQVPDVIKIVTCSILFSLVSTLYPAWRATRVMPVEALRYE